MDEMNATGAVLVGRRTVEQVDHWGRNHHGVPIFVLSHRLPGPSVDNYSLLACVTDGIVSAMAQAIGVDLQGHGRTPLGDREISLVDMGNDMAGVLKKLGYEKVDVLGYSMGGGVAFQLAVQHPVMVRRLLLVSTPFAQDGFYPEMLPQQAALGAAMAEQMKETRMYKSYAAIAPHPEDFPKLLDQMGAYMRKPYDWSADVKKLTMPVMLIYGDSDMFRPEHEVKFYQLLDGGLEDAGWQREHMSQNRLAILPNLTHYEIGTAPQLVDTALPFLNGTGWPVPRAGGNQSK